MTDYNWYACIPEIIYNERGVFRVKKEVWMAFAREVLIHKKEKKMEHSEYKIVKDKYYQKQHSRYGKLHCMKFLLGEVPLREHRK